MRCHKKTFSSSIRPYFFFYLKKLTDLIPKSCSHLPLCQNSSKSFFRREKVTEGVYLNLHRYTIMTCIILPTFISLSNHSTTNHIATESYPHTTEPSWHAVVLFTSDLFFQPNKELVNIAKLSSYWSAKTDLLLWGNSTTFCFCIVLHFNSIKCIPRTFYLVKHRTDRGISLATA